MTKRISATRKTATGVNRFDLADNVFSFAIGVIIMFAIFLIFMVDKDCFQTGLQTVTVKQEKIPVKEETIQIQEKGEKIEEVIETQENEKIVAYTDEDLKLLSRLMYAEEGVLLQRQSMENAELAHKLCGSVVLHRTKMGYLGQLRLRKLFMQRGSMLKLLCRSYLHKRPLK